MRVSLKRNWVSGCFMGRYLKPCAIRTCHPAPGLPWLLAPRSGRVTGELCVGKRYKYESDQVTSKAQLKLSCPGTLMLSWRVEVIGELQCGPEKEPLPLPYREDLFCPVVVVEEWMHCSTRGIQGMMIQ